MEKVAIVNTQETRALESERNSEVIEPMTSLCEKTEAQRRDMLRTQLTGSGPGLTLGSLLHSLQRQWTGWFHDGSCLCAGVWGSAISSLGPFLQHYLLE